MIREKALLETMLVFSTTVEKGKLRSIYTYSL